MNLYISGVAVKEGERIKDFRGESWAFVGVEREPEPGKSGKVKVLDCAGGFTRIFYPTVFEGEIR